MRAAVFTPKKPVWLYSTSIVAIAAVVAFVVLAWWEPWRPGRAGGLTCGIAAALLFANAGTYPLRRRLRVWPLGTAQRWLQLHVYGSALAAVLVVLHMGARMPAGAMGWWLFGLTLWTTATGMLGVFLQKWVPLTIARRLRVEAIYERIPELVSRLADEAAAVAAASGDTLKKAYENDIHALMTSPRLDWRYVGDVHAMRERRLEPLMRTERFLDAADRARLETLTTIVSDKLALDAHASLQRVLRLWLQLHVPAAMVLLGLLTVHIFAVIAY
jgi:hypothetical protein